MPIDTSFPPIPVLAERASSSLTLPAFTRTIQHLNVHRPVNLLVLSTAVSGSNRAGPYNPSCGHSNRSALLNKLEDEFAISCEAVPRKFWTREAGFGFIQDLCVPGEIRTSTLMSIGDRSAQWMNWLSLQNSPQHCRHHAVCSTAAVFHWIQNEQGIVFPRHSLQIRFAASTGVMFIDSESASNLELVANRLSRRPKDSLFGG